MAVPIMHQTFGPIEIHNHNNVSLICLQHCTNAPRGLVPLPNHQWYLRGLISRAKILGPVASKQHRMTATTEVEGCSTAVAGKGHCVMYTTDGRRFEVPLAYLRTAVFSELLRMSEEVFGLAGSERGIKLPCDAMVMEYAMSLLRRSASAEMEAAFLSSMVMPCYYAAPPFGEQLGCFGQPKTHLPIFELGLENQRMYRNRFNDSAAHQDLCLASKS